MLTSDSVGNIKRIDQFSDWLKTANGDLHILWSRNFKKRLDNYGESNMHYIQDHHKAIISREDFEATQEIY